MPVSEDDLDADSRTPQVIGEDFVNDDEGAEPDDEVIAGESDSSGERLPGAEDEEESEEPASDEVESEETPEESEEPLPDNATLAQIKARYGNDPDKMAEALLAKEKMIGRQGNEIGELRHAQGQSPTDKPPIGVNGTTDPDKLPDEFFEPVEDWRKLEVDPRSGYLIHPVNGNAIEPFSALGIPFKPPSYWEHREKQLMSANPDNPVRVATTIMREQQQEQTRYDNAVSQKLQAASAYATSISTLEETALAKQFGKNYDEATSRSLAKSYVSEAVRGITELVKTGRVDPRQAFTKNAIRIATMIVKDDAERSGKLEEDAAAMMKATDGKPAPKATPAPKNGARAPMPKSGGIKLAGKSTNKIGMDDAEYKAKGMQNYAFED